MLLNLPRNLATPAVLRGNTRYVPELQQFPRQICLTKEHLNAHKTFASVFAMHHSDTSKQRMITKRFQAKPKNTVRTKLDDLRCRLSSSNKTTKIVQKMTVDWNSGSSVRSPAEHKETHNPFYPIRNYNGRLKINC